MTSKHTVPDLGNWEERGLDGFEGVRPKVICWSRMFHLFNINNSCVSSAWTVSREWEPLDVCVSTTGTRFLITFQGHYFNTQKVSGWGVKQTVNISDWSSTPRTLFQSSSLKACSCRPVFCNIKFILLISVVPTMPIPLQMWLRNATFCPKLKYNGNISLATFNIL